MNKTLRGLSTEELVLFAHELCQELRRRIQSAVSISDLDSTINRLVKVLEEEDSTRDTSNEKLKGC